MALPVVLVHGGGHGAWCWAPMVEHLTSDALAVDLPPRAVRGGPDRFRDLPELRTMTVGDFADSVLADADAAGYDRFVLVGHSLAGAHPARGRAASRPIGSRTSSSSRVRSRPRADRSLDRCWVATSPPAVRDSDRGSMARPATGEIAERPGRRTVLRHMFGTDLDDEAMRSCCDHFGNEVMPADRRAGVATSGCRPTPEDLDPRCLRDVARVGRRSRTRASPTSKRRRAGPVTVVDLDTGHNAMLSRPGSWPRSSTGSPPPYLILGRSAR